MNKESLKRNRMSSPRKNPLIANHSLKNSALSDSAIGPDLTDMVVGGQSTVDVVAQDSLQFRGDRPVGSLRASLYKVTG
jgi:hypothetical protein